MQIIAVLTNNPYYTWLWLMNSYLYKDDILEANYTNHTIRMKDDSLYVMIDSKQKAEGLQFASYIRSPHYESLEDVVKTRIRQK